ncbi:penicillin-binding protein [Dactylosporangium aurantiacum]|uniref:Penicillin-binding protein n=1 Tax=Dactylosporangium aurantiacum TaxID=35754 RepID=A0A9Q9IKW1_9ACTN|nr:transglycosylase domain-containing protein [Dactylosporangium aurantiacum]MDG6105774.1 transglycosylase domain-containing protein [Dactylosporangium aurantiacum]UWZ58037.1 penicillin-binding protein [Dactylosporangium aurantiacum]
MDDDNDRTSPSTPPPAADDTPQDTTGASPSVIDLAADGKADSAAAGAGAAGSAAPPAGKRRSRWRRRLLVTLLVLTVLAGLGCAGGTYYYDSVALPEDVDLRQTTTIYYADGATPMARVGDTNRTVVPIQDIPVDVQHAVVAAQDETFYSNSGVDYGDAAGAAWNHLAGDGDRGASTISQQYARQWADLEGGSYARKLRESVIATKLNEQYSKDQILAMYLNIVYFGRGAYGIQAAAQAYFGKPAKDLTLAEGMVLAGLIDQPEGTDGKGSPFDPTVDPQRARARFDQVKRQLTKLNFVAPAEADVKTAYPAKVLTAAEARANSVTLLGSSGMDRPEGLIVHHVLGEVAALTDPKTGRLLYEDTAPDGRKHFDRLRDGGLKIVTTIDQKAQQIAVREASRTAGSNMSDQPTNLQAALVAVEPGTGAVKAYYGGDTGYGGDYAGFYADPVLSDGQDSCCGGHPAGATFHAYTLAAGLKQGYTTGSYWNGSSPQDFPASGRTGRNNNAVRNAGENSEGSPACASGSPTWCTLEESTVMALRTPFFGLAEKVGPGQVIDTARAAGITQLWANVDQRQMKVDLTKNDGKAVFPKFFNTEVALGQYPVTVLDQAAGMATFAARGVAARTHFLQEVWQDGRKTYTAAVKPARIPGFTEPMADDLTAVLQGVPQHYGLQLRDGRQVAGIAGSWQLGPTTDNAHAWMVGYTASDPAGRNNGLAVAVWVGNKAEERKIVDRAGAKILGGTLPGMIWRDFLDETLTALNTPKATFAPRKNVGDQQLGTGIQPVR